MIRELYCKLPTDLDYIPSLESEDDLFNLLQQIRVVLGTKPGEVLGSPMFGIDLEKYLFTMNYNKDEIIEFVNIAIQEYLVYNRNKFQVGIDVLFGHNADDAYEYALIDISINERKCLGIIVNQQ